MKIITDIKNKTIVLNNEEPNPNNNFIDFGFSFVTNGRRGASFNNLSFEYSVFDGDTLLGSDSYPKDNSIYISSDQDYLEVSRVSGFRPNRNYTVNLSINNNNENFSSALDLFIPKLVQPYESWIWNDEKIIWEAPTPQPEDGKFYTWNEEEKVWVLFISDVELDNEL
jgi:hypothetical protein